MTTPLDRVMAMLPTLAPVFRALLVHTAFCDPCRISVAASYLSGAIPHLLTMEATPRNRDSAASQLLGGLVQWANGEPHADLSLALAAELFTAMNLPWDEARSRAYLYLWASEKFQLHPASFPLKAVRRGLSGSASQGPPLLAFVNLTLARSTAASDPSQAKETLDAISTKHSSGPVAHRLTWLKARALHALGDHERASRTLRGVYKAFVEAGEAEAASLALTDCAGLTPEQDIPELVAAFLERFSIHPLAMVIAPLASSDFDAVRPKLPSSFFRFLAAPPTS